MFLQNRFQLFLKGLTVLNCFPYHKFINFYQFFNLPFPNKKLSAFLQFNLKFKMGNSATVVKMGEPTGDIALIGKYIHCSY